MLVMANQNGDWIEVTNGSPFWILDTDDPVFREAFAKENGKDTLAEETNKPDFWVDKFEWWIEEYGKPIRLWIDGGKLGFHN